MAILSTDIQERLSGGASNALPISSLGGAKSTNVAPVGIFDNVSGSEAAVGSVEYRCIYIHNAHASLTLTSPFAWLESNTPSASTTIDIGIGTSAVNGTEQSIAGETSGPSGVSFVAAATKGAGLSLGDIPAGQSRAIWLRRTVTAGAAAIASNTFSIKVEGDTAT